MDGLEPSVEAHVVVRGHVQGVYFRGSLQRQCETPPAPIGFEIRG